MILASFDFLILFCIISLWWWPLMHFGDQILSLFVVGLHYWPLMDWLYLPVSVPFCRTLPQCLWVWSCAMWPALANETLASMMQGLIFLEHPLEDGCHAVKKPRVDDWKDFGRPCTEKPWRTRGQLRCCYPNQAPSWTQSSEWSRLCDMKHKMTPAEPCSHRELWEIINHWFFVV